MADRPERHGFRSPVPAPKEALEYFRFRGLRTGFDYRDVWQEEHALAFTVAKAMEIDLLKDLRAAIDRALSEGWTFHRFEKELAPLLRERGWWGKKMVEDPKTGERVRAQLGSPNRLRTIYESNLRAARAAGQWDRAQRTKTTHPFFLYEPALREPAPGRKRCDRHRAWAGTILPVDDPWWDDHFPPNGWGCRCRVRQITRREADRRGGATDPPPRKEVSWWNRRAGRFEKTDEGLDPAWATNPGKYRERVLAGHLDGRVDAADRALAAAAHRSLMRSPLLEGFHQRIVDYGRRHPDEAKARRVEIRDRVFEERLGDFWIALLDERARRALKAPAGADLRPTLLVRLSPETALKQLKHLDPEKHERPLRLSDYRRLPDVIENGEMLVEDANHLAFVHRIDDAWYKAAVKQTRHNELFLTTFHRVHDWDLDRSKRRSAKGESLEGPLT